VVFLDFIKELFSFKPECNYCHYTRKDMNKTINYNDKKGFICAECLRVIRFRENDFFKSIQGIEDAK